MDEQQSQQPAPSGKSNLPLIIGIIVVVVAVGAYFALRSKSNNYEASENYQSTTPADNSSVTTVPADNMTPPPDNTTPPATPPTTPPPTSQVKSFTITASSFKFDPATITVNKGDTVKIHFVNADGFHNWTLEGYNVATPKIQAGQTADLTFVADKTGTFAYFCSVANHRAMGMEGKLTVK